MRTEMSDRPIDLQDDLDEDFDGREIYNDGELDDDDIEDSDEDDEEEEEEEDDEEEEYDDLDDDFDED